MTKNYKTTLRIKKAINMRFKSIEIAYQNFRNNPYSNDHVHRLRVELRKMRALISFLKPIFKKEDYNQLNQNMKLIGQKLSKKRDLDTLIEALEDTAVKEAQLVQNYAEIFAYLENERLKEADFIGSKEAILSYDDMLMQSKSRLNALELDLDKKKHDNAESFVIKRLKTKAKKLKKNYKKTNLNDYETVHNLRKDAKKVRYAAIGLKSVLPKRVKRKIKKDAKKMQEDLGSRTDNFAIVTLLKQYRDSSDELILQQSFKQLIDYYDL